MMETSLAISLMRAAATAPPSSSKTMDTVVEVGSPMELKASSRRTSVIITAKKTIMISLKVNISGLKTPLRAISIMPLEKVEPARTPMLATTMMTLKLAMREPMAELRKFTASLLTPTNRSTMARMARKATMIRKMLSTFFPRKPVLVNKGAVRVTGPCDKMMTFRND